jgi:hypothetical protein
MIEVARAEIYAYPVLLPVRVDKLFLLLAYYPYPKGVLNMALSAEVV